MRKLTIKGPNKVPAGQEIRLAALLDGKPGVLPPKSKLHLYWFDNANGSELGKGPELGLGAMKPGSYSISARLYQDRCKLPREMQHRANRTETPGTLSEAL